MFETFSEIGESHIQAVGIELSVLAVCLWVLYHMFETFSEIRESNLLAVDIELCIVSVCL